MCTNLTEHIYNTHNLRVCSNQGQENKSSREGVVSHTLLYCRAGITDTHFLGLKRGAWDRFSFTIATFSHVSNPWLWKKLRNTAILTKNHWPKAGKVHTHHEKAGEKPPYFIVLYHFKQNRNLTYCISPVGVN